LFAILLYAGVTSEASMVFFRSVPVEGVWAEWTIESNLQSEGVQLRVRLTAGGVVERDGQRCQEISLIGTWEDDGKPVPINARYEVDLEKLKKAGFPRGATRLIAAYKKNGETLQKIGEDDPLRVFYECILLRLGSSSVAKETVKLNTPAHLEKYDLHVLSAKTDTPHLGNAGRASSFTAWVAEEVPFGVAKWQMKTQVGFGRDGTEIEMTATLTSTGRTTAGSESLQEPTRRGQKDSD
jgi:hypothetical protein